MVTVSPDFWVDPFLAVASLAAFVVFRMPMPVAVAVPIVNAVLEMVMVLGGSNLGLTAPPALPADYSNTKALGRLLYTDYVYPFELAAVLLLVAMIAAIALTHRKRRDFKQINPAEQVKVKRADRIFMANIKPQKPEAPKEDDE